jgi:hypothetical protein
MTTKKSTVVFLIYFFIKFSGSQTFFEKRLDRFSRKISTFAIIGSIVTYCGVLPLVKISAQLSKSSCIYNG